MQPLNFALVRHRADADHTLAVDGGIALVWVVEAHQLPVGIPTLLDWPTANVRHGHGGDGIVPQFRGRPDDRRLGEGRQAFEPLPHLAATAASLRLILERNEKLFPGALFTSACDLERSVLLVSFLANARIARREGDQYHEQGHENHGCRDQSSAVPLRQLLEQIQPAGRPRGYRVAVQMALDVHRQAVGRLVAPGAVFLQAFHHDPIQIAPHGTGQFRDTRFSLPAQRGGLGQPQRAQAGGRPGRFLLADRAPHFVQPGAQQLLPIEWRFAGQQFVKQDAEAVNVAAGVNVHTAHLRLLGTGVGRRADERMEVREQGFFGQSLAGGLGNAEVNHLGYRRAVVDRDENVGGFDVAVDDALLMRVLDRLADLDKQIQPLLGGELGLIAVIGDAHAAH